MAGDVELPRRRRWPYLVGILAFLLYAAWMLGPYLRSIVVRDAAITTWSRIATAPIDGSVEFAPREAGGAVGPGGVIAWVRNRHASRQELERAQADVARNAAELEELQQALDEIKTLEDDRQDVKADYAQLFRDQLDVQIENLLRRVEIADSLLAVVQQIADRKTELQKKGVGSPNEADEAALRVHQAAFDLAALQADLAFAKVRRAAADQGIFTTGDGDDPGWALGDRMALKLEKKLTRLQLRQATAEQAYLAARLASAEDDLVRLSEAAIAAPPGAVVWSERASPGADVLAGQAVAEWLDCAVLLVDVPVSDVEAALLRQGQAAVVLLEGEREERAARVAQVRGAASILGREELVALAKGREPGTAQALLALEPGGAPFHDCPVGRAAFVDFPDIGLLDVILARLRL